MKISQCFDSDSRNKLLSRSSLSLFLSTRFSISSAFVFSKLSFAIKTLFPCITMKPTYRVNDLKPYSIKAYLFRNFKRPLFKPKMVENKICTLCGPIDITGTHSQLMTMLIFANTRYKVRQRGEGRKLYSTLHHCCRAVYLSLCKVQSLRESKAVFFTVHQAFLRFLQSPSKGLRFACSTCFILTSKGTGFY